MRYRTMTAGIILMAVLLLAGVAHADVTAERSAALDAENVKRVFVTARAGSLRIDGLPDVDEIKVRGVAGASRQGILEDIKLNAYLDGDSAYVTAEIPNYIFGNAYLDLVLEVPLGVALIVTDSSGETRISSVSSVRLDDSSGGIIVSYISGDVEIEDSSGSIEVRRVGGTLRISDSSGDIIATEISGDVLIAEDGSGDMKFSDIMGDVIIRDDGSGSIDVRNVGGDFIVKEDGSGSVTSRNVKGEISIP